MTDWMVVMHPLAEPDVLAPPADFARMAVEGRESNQT